jgi:type III secretion protein W
MNRIDTGSVTPGFSSLGQQPGLNTGAQPQTGTLMGEKAVLMSGEVSSLGDAAEELSLHMAEKTEDKHHAERKVKSERSMELLDTSEIVEMLEQGKDGDAQEKLTELTKKILGGEGSPRQLAGQSFGDVSQQYLGLQYALREGEKEGASSETLEAIRDALADLEIESGPQIRAGLNTLRTAGEFAGDAQGVAGFQETYRDIVLGENTLSKTLDLAIERFGTQDVGRGLSKLVAALGQDLAAARPSTEPSRLQSLTGDLYQLQVAVTVLDGCRELSGQLQAGGHGQIDSQRLMRDLVSVTGEKWVSESRFTNLARQHNVNTLEGRIAFLSAVKTMLRDLPVQVYPDADTRQSILNAVQEALDIAIDEEDQQ